MIKRLVLALCFGLIAAPPANSGGELNDGYDGAQAIQVSASGQSSNLPVPTGPASRIKDIATLQTARDNQLIGYGLVIGLQGTGDGLRNSPFTEQSIRAMLRNLGIAMEDGRARSARWRCP
jgi:flagellar P-ring protein precursor FlgI